MERFIIIANCGTIERADLENLCAEYDGKHHSLLRTKLNTISSNSDINFSMVTVSEFCDMLNDEVFNADDNWVHNVTLETSEILYTDDERFKIIDTLVDNDIIDVKQGLYNDDVSFLSDVLMGNGWNGYMKLNDTQLQVELEAMNE